MSVSWSKQRSLKNLNPIDKTFPILQAMASFSASSPRRLAGETLFSSKLFNISAALLSQTVNKYPQSHEACVYMYVCVYTNTGRKACTQQQDYHPQTGTTLTLTLNPGGSGAASKAHFGPPPPLHTGTRTHTCTQNVYAKWELCCNGVWSLCPHIHTYANIHTFNLSTSAKTKQLRFILHSWSCANPTCLLNVLLSENAS